MLTKDQLLASLDSDSFVEQWLALSPQMVEESLGKAAAAMVDFDQRNPHHCYTLFEHCLRTTAGIKGDSPIDRLLQIAALFHDIAKPLVAREKQGRLVFYGHAKKSAEIMRPLLPQLGLSAKESFYILFWIEHHDDFISFTDDAAKAANGGRVLINQASITKYLAKLQRSYPALNEAAFKLLLEKLLLLCLADAKAQSELVMLNGVLTDSKSAKVQRLELIKKFL